MSDSLTFIQYFFLKRHKRKFVTGEQHRKIADALNDVLSEKINRLIINIPPRYSKTEMIKEFMAQGLAINPKSLFLLLSYSDSLALDNSLAVREIVAMPEYQELFNVRIKKNVDSKRRWSTVQGGGIYATSTLGQVTGFGAGAMDLTDGEQKALSEENEAYTDEMFALLSQSSGFAGAIIIDDPIKPEDALSDLIRDKVNNRFENTIRSRTNSRNTPIIIIMQRLALNDLSGYLMEAEPGEWTVLSLPALIEDENGERALFPHKHTVEELKKLREVDQFIFDTQYQQNPMPKEGLMYENGFREYATRPPSRYCIRKAYIDSADTGSDFLCAIIYDETEIANYVVDVMYTQKAMEYTEPELARMLSKHNVTEALFESNNGGRGFARAVEGLCRLQGNNRTKIQWFHQTLNKDVRIFTHSAAVQNLTFMPEGWIKLFPAFASSLLGYSKVGRNQHDDAEDTLTGTVENRKKPSKPQDLTKYF